MITRRRRPGWWYFLAGVVAAVLGLLPWLITGLRLPLQNLWATEVLPGRMPIALLPFSQYQLSLILGMIIFGSALAGLFTRAMPTEDRGRAMRWVGGGVLLIFVGAGVQTTVVLLRGLADESRTELYLAVLVALTLLAIVVGLMALALLAIAPVPGASIGATLGAMAAGIWLNALIFPSRSVGTEVNTRLLGYATWVPAILVGLVLAWCGLNSVGRVVAWVVDLLLLWIIPAGLTAMSYGTGSRVLARNPVEMLSASGQVFRLAHGPAGISLRLAMVAFVIGVIGWVLRRLVRLPGRAD